MTLPRPIRVESASRLRVQLGANGALQRIDCGEVTLNLFAGNEVEGGPANLFLRRRAAAPGAAIEATPLLGPRSPARFGAGERGFCAIGAWSGVHFRVSLVLARAAAAWFWHVELENRGAADAELDLIHAQDLALADYGFLRNNEHYVSHYVDYTPLEHARCGRVLAVRQNLAIGGRHPWAVLGSLGRAVAYATDALDWYGLSVRAGLPPAALAAPELSGRRRQHEHSLAVLQEQPFRLARGESAARGFFGWFEPGHEPASGDVDLAAVDAALALPEAAPPPRGDDPPLAAPAVTPFTASPLLACRDLRDDELAPLFGGDLREFERDRGRALSCFAGAARHVVLRAKELAVLRPHGHVLRTGDRLVPEEASLVSTAWMGGAFHSLLTQGHVGINRLLSAQRGYLGLFRSHGQRVFAEYDGVWQLLDVPSAWEVEPSGCRWIYRHARGALKVRSFAPADRHELALDVAVIDGAPCRFLVSHHVAVAGDDGAAAARVRFARDERGVTVALPPDSELGRRFPGGSFRIAPAAGTEIERAGGDELLFADGRSRGQPFLVLITAPARAIGLRIIGQLAADARAEPDADRAAPQVSRSEPKASEDQPQVSRSEPKTSEDQPQVSRSEPKTSEDEQMGRAQRFWRELTGPLALEPPARGAFAGEVAQLQQILPWFAHDAAIHYLAPRGLEQQGGGGWGTRDVCQGPVEWLLAHGRWQPLRELLRIVFRAQNPDGDWPQWFMYFPRERAIRPRESHGDIVFWPLLALGRYLLAAEDASILDDELPFYDDAGDARAERAALWAHAERALALTRRRVVAGTRLAAYGNGDWNDSLQPADPAMREQLCSAWTVGLHVETLEVLARGLRRVGRAGAAAACEADAAEIRTDFQRWLVADGALAGFAYFHRDGRVERWMHPSDAATGIRTSLIPIAQALTSGLFTREQAAAHVARIRAHLLAPDGARLFDRPTRYQGGPQRHFQRAESSAYFGREIALSYTHAHLRYAEAIARWGDGDALFAALQQANPIGLRARLPSARPRQACCYTTSSDAAFADRYEAAARYAEVMAGRVPLEGGWRVYSSGPGIFVRLVHECLLGVRQSRSRLLLDPVLPRALDGLRARVAVAGAPLELEYRIRARGCGPIALSRDGRPLAFEREPHPYRTGGAEIPLSALRGRAGAAQKLVVELE